MRTGLAFFFIVSIAIAGCRIEKRHYMRGYHVELFTAHKAPPGDEKKEGLSINPSAEAIEENISLKKENPSQKIAAEDGIVSLEEKDRLLFKNKKSLLFPNKEKELSHEGNEEAQNITSQIHPAAAGSFLMGLLSALCFVMLFVTSFNPLPLVIALCLGIVVFAFLAKRLSTRAFEDMYHARNRYGGKALAAAGLALGVISVVALIGIIAVMLFGIAFISLS